MIHTLLLTGEFLAPRGPRGAPGEDLREAGKEGKNMRKQPARLLFAHCVPDVCRAAPQ